MNRFNLVPNALSSLNYLKEMQKKIEQELKKYLQTIAPSIRTNNEIFLTNVMNTILEQKKLKMDPVEKLIDKEVSPEEITLPILLTFLLREISYYLFDTIVLTSELRNEFYLRESTLKKIEPNYRILLEFINNIAKELDPNLSFSFQYLYRLWCDKEESIGREMLIGFLNWSGVYSYKLLNGVSIEELLENILKLEEWERAIPLEYDVDALVYAYAKLLKNNIKTTDNELILKRIKKMRQK